MYLVCGVSEKLDHAIAIEEELSKIATFTLLKQTPFNINQASFFN